MRPLRLLSGRDIIARFGVAEGPEIGRLLAELEEAQAAGDVRDIEGALAFVRAQLRGAEEQGER